MFDTPLPLIGRSTSMKVTRDKSGNLEAAVAKRKSAFRRRHRAFPVALALTTSHLISCGGGGDGGGSTKPTPMYRVGGTVSGLSGSGFVLQNNGGDNLSVSAIGAFAFSTQLMNGVSYSVTVFA